MQNVDELDKLVETWTINRSSEEVMIQMQEAGVSASVVANSEDLHHDPQLKHRGHFWVLDHPEIGPHSYDSPSFRLSKTPIQLRMPTPCLGEHTEYVCTKILGMSDEEFVELLQKGVVGGQRSNST
jgi:benzylsuccinate CoA-transferase BbsF subunit